MDEFVLKTLENATAMTIVGLALMIMWRFMGQKTDPKLVELLELITNAGSKRDDDSRKAYNRLVIALEGNNEEWSTVKESIGLLIDTMQKFITDIPIAHAAQNEAIAAIPEAIIPSIDILSVNVKEYTDKTEEARQGIMETMTPLEQSLREIRDELQALRESIDTRWRGLKEEVDTKTEQIESRLLQVEKTATQETPVIQPDSDKPKTEEKS